MIRFQRVAVIAVLLILCASATFAQSEGTKKPDAANTLYFEIGGKGLLYGFYYERLITRQLGVSVGYSSWDVSIFNSVNVTIIPFFVSWYAAGEEHHLYVDAGADYVRVQTEILEFGTFKGSG